MLLLYINFGFKLDMTIRCFSGFKPCAICTERLVVGVCTTGETKQPKTNLQSSTLIQESTSQLQKLIPELIPPKQHLDPGINFPTFFCCGLASGHSRARINFPRSKVDSRADSTIAAPESRNQLPNFCFAVDRLQSRPGINFPTSKVDSRVDSPKAAP